MPPAPILKLVLGTLPTPHKRAVVVVASGGLDSAVLLRLMQTWAGPEGHARALSIDYGQRHLREIGYAHKFCAQGGIPHKVVYLSALGGILTGSSQTDPTIPVPEGHYEDESMKTTVVPNRNMIILSVAIGYAIAEECSFVACGAHAGDHAIYPDCRPSFLWGMDHMATICHYTPIHVLAPFLELTKAQIVSLGVALQVPFEDTWSCYNSGPIHCGKCGTCVERREAFELAGVTDPTKYMQ